MNGGYTAKRWTDWVGIFGILSSRGLGGTSDLGFNGVVDLLGKTLCHLCRHPGFIQLRCSWVVTLVLTIRLPGSAASLGLRLLVVVVVGH